MSLSFDARSLAGYQGRVNQSSQLNGLREKSKSDQEKRKIVRTVDRVCAKRCQSVTLISHTHNHIKKEICSHYPIEFTHFSVKN